MTLIEYINPAITPKLLMMAAMGFSLACKLFFFGASVRYFFKTQHYRSLLTCLLIFLTGSILSDTCDLGVLIKRGIFQIRDDFPLFTLLNRIDWILFLSSYQALAFFFEFLVHRKIRLHIFHIINFLANIAITSCFIYLAVFKYGVPSSSPETLSFELKVIQWAFIALPFFFLPAAYTIIKKMWKGELPAILVHQLKYLMYFLVPYIIMETVNHQVSYLGKLVPFLFPYKDLLFTLCMILSTIAIYILSKKIVAHRFLNIREAVTASSTFTFLATCNDILEQLNYASALKELNHLIQSFLLRTFSIPSTKTVFIIRKNDAAEQQNQQNHQVSIIVESFIQDKEKALFSTNCGNPKIFIRDEIQFSHFYENTPEQKEILQFLDALNADVFLPIYERTSINAYIIIGRDARPQKLFTSKERDEMLVFTTYVSNIINILVHSQSELIRQQHKYLMDELYQKHQEINQHKESMRSFMRRERKTGILYYKNRRFIMANEAAHELLGIDPNQQLGHPLSQALTATARKIDQYKTSQVTFARDSQGAKLVIEGMSGPDQTPILLVSYPEISDIINAQLTQLKDPSSWDYLLYLETTQSGKLINQLIPGSSEKLLAFKINLLSTALSKKATLLEMAHEDCMPTVEILHAISMRSQLHTIKMSHYEKNNEIGLALFGLSPLFDTKGVPPLLEKLDSQGTLYIENIEYLSIETQEQLARFISHGFYTAYKSDHKKISDVRIICSTTKDLLALVHEGSFSQALYTELRRMSLSMPLLTGLSADEMENLAQELADQLITNDTYKHLLSLTEKDKAMLVNDRPLSLHECKEKIIELLKEKTVEHGIDEITEFDRAATIADPTIAQAIRLGKKALKDPHAMSLLWNKFKNQNTIAQLLGVNRSSVNRRCHEYNLIIDKVEAHT